MPGPEGGAPNEPQQLALMREMVVLAEERNRQSALRTELSAERSYLNAERTLSVWVRTALAVMVVGIAIDRFGLSTTHQRVTGIQPDTLSTWVGAAMVAFGVLIAAVTGARFWRYTVAYCEHHEPPLEHGPSMGPTFALLTSLFGVVLCILLLTTL